MTSAQFAGVLLAAIVIVSAGVVLVLGLGFGLIALGVLVVPWAWQVYDPDLDDDVDGGDE